MPIPAIAAGLAAALRTAGAAAVRYGATAVRGGSAAVSRGAAATSRGAVATERAAASTARSVATAESSGASEGAKSFYRMMETAQTVTADTEKKPAQVTAKSGDRSYNDPMQGSKETFEQMNRQMQDLADYTSAANQGIDSWTRRLSKSAEELREFSATANEQVAILERDRRKRQFERGSAAGPSAAFAAQQTNRLEQNIGKLVSLGESIWNFMQGIIAQFVNYQLEFFRVEAISGWLTDVLNKVFFGADKKDKNDGRTPWLSMLGELARPDAFAPPPVPNRGNR
jgi:phage-related protein